MAVDPELLRAVMRHWPTGVAVLSSRHGARTHGMTVNSFTSVSLEPPLILTCVEQVVRTHKLIQRSGIFAISFLRAGQEAISNRFAGRETEHTNRFEGLDTFTAVTGAPILADNLGYLDCLVVASYPAANHTIFVAEVAAASTGSVPADAPAADGLRPLLYFNRDYHQLC